MGAINYANIEGYFPDFVRIGVPNPSAETWTDEDYSLLSDKINDINESLLYFKFSIENGYYDGNYVVLDTTENCYNFENEAQHEEAIEETFKVKDAFYNLVDSFCLVDYVASWSPGYFSEEETRSNINKAIAEIQQVLVSRDFLVYAKKY